MRDTNQLTCKTRVDALGALVLAALLTAGCTVGPKYQRPDIQIPSAFRATSDAQQAEGKAESFADLPWWQVFHDPQLQELIRTALKQNFDLQLATERINAIRQLVSNRGSKTPSFAKTLRNS